MITQLVLKDLKRIVRDRKVLLIILLMPLVLTAILGFSVGQFLSSSATLDEFTIGIVNEADMEADAKAFDEWSLDYFGDDAMPIAEGHELTEQLKLVDFVEVFREEVLENQEVKAFLSYEALDAETAQQQLKDGKLAAVLIIPEQFYYKSWVNLLSRDVSPVELELLKQKDMEFSASIFEEITRSYLGRLTASITAKNAFLDAADEYGVGDRASMHAQPVMMQVFAEHAGVAIEEKTVDSMKRVSGLQYYSAAMSAMFMLFTAGAVSQFFIAERKQFTFQRMMVAGTGFGRVIASIFLTGTIITFLQLSILQLGTMGMFQIDWGSSSNLLLINAVLSMSVGILAVLLSSINYLFNDERATSFFENIVVQIMAFLGGSMLPMGAMPESLAKAGNFFVNGLGLRAYLKNMQGYGWGEFQSLFLSLLLVSVVTLCIGMVIFLIGNKRRDVA